MGGGRMVARKHGRSRWVATKFGTSLAHPRVAALGSEKRLRVLDSAKRYLLEGSARNKEWIGTRTWPFNAVAAYEALVVLLQFVPGFIDALPSDRWAEWITVLLTFMREATEEFANELFKKAYRSN